MKIFSRVIIGVLVAFVVLGIVGSFCAVILYKSTVAAYIAASLVFGAIVAFYSIPCVVVPHDDGMVDTLEMKITTMAEAIAEVSRRTQQSKICAFLSLCEYAEKSLGYEIEGNSNAFTIKRLEDESAKTMLDIRPAPQNWERDTTIFIREER